MAVHTSSDKRSEVEWEAVGSSISAIRELSKDSVGIDPLIPPTSLTAAMPCGRLLRFPRSSVIL